MRLKKVYSGTRDKAGVCTVVVMKNTKETYGLPVRSDLCSYTALFNWGYGGSGPSQLALAILADHLGAKICKDGKLDATGKKAVHYHQKFKRLFIEPIKADAWGLHDHEIQMSLKEFDGEEKARSVHD